MPRGTGTGTGFAKTRGVYHPRTGMPPKPTENLATAVQVSIDTAVQHCEVKFGGGELGWATRHWYGSGRHSRLCSHFILVFGYMFVWVVRADTGCG